MNKLVNLKHLSFLKVTLQININKIEIIFFLSHKFQ